MFGDALKGYLKSSGLDQKFRELPVFDAWIEAVGEALARRARPVRFHAGELTVEVESAAHRQELVSFSGEQYRKLANRRLGRETIERVLFKLKR